MQGVRSMKKTDLNPVYVVIKPPSLEILVSRRMSLASSPGPGACAHMFCNWQYPKGSCSSLQMSHQPLKDYCMHLVGASGPNLPL